MNEAAKILDAQTLDELRTALVRFAGAADGALHLAAAEIQRTRDWLREREHYWQRQMEAARRAHEACLRQGQRKDDKKRDSCAAEAAAVRRAEAQLRKVLHWKARVERAIGEYERHARRLCHLTTAERERAQAFLARKRAQVEQYEALGGPVAQALAELQTLRTHSPNVAVGTRGAGFERWAQQYIFGSKRRVHVRPENNAHLIKTDHEERGLSKSRTSDNYVDADGSLWDAKAYSASSAIDEEQLRDYRVMQDAGYVYDHQNNRVEVKSINYLFSDRAAAAANAWRFKGIADVWYVDEMGMVQLLED